CRSTWRSRSSWAIGAPCSGRTGGSGSTSTTACAGSRERRMKGIDRRRFAVGLLGGAALPAFAALDASPNAAADASADTVGRNILRIAFEAAETGFDPARISDLYSSRVTSHIFEG